MGLALAAMIGPAVTLLGIRWGSHGLWNDFASYWLAGKLVAAGHTPYDLTALARLAVREGIQFQPGTGYSYPLPFAVLMVPLATLPFTLAASLFTAVSVLVFGWAIASWLSDQRTFAGGRRMALVVALSAGFYPPVGGSVFFGQANLLVLGVLALGVKRWMHPDGGADWWGGVAIGVAGIVKAVPLALILPALLARRLGGVAGILAGAGASMAAALLVAPFGLGGVGRLVEMGAPDPFWTNQSLNGFISRLTLRNERTIPFLRGLDPTVAAWVIFTLFTIVTLTVLWRARDRLAVRQGYWLAIGFTLVAAVIATPKNSFWNQLPALVGVGLLIAADPRHWRAGLTRWLVVAWYGMALVQLLVDSLSGDTLQSWGPLGALLSSAAVVGLLALWLALGCALLKANGVVSSAVSGRASTRPGRGPEPAPAIGSVQATTAYTSAMRVKLGSAIEVEDWQALAVDDELRLPLTRLAMAQPGRPHGR